MAHVYPGCQPAPQGAGWNSLLVKDFNGGCPGIGAVTFAAHNEQITAHGISRRPANWQCNCEIVRADPANT